MKQKKSTNVTQLKNDYTQTKTVQSYRQHKQKKSVKRRVAVIAAVSGVLITILGANLFSSTRQLTQMETEKVASAEELGQVEKTNEQLQSEITKLENEDYIAKLARSQYYLTKDDEIVFSFPEDNAAQMKEEEKESGSQADEKETEEE